MLNGKFEGHFISYHKNINNKGEREEYYICYYKSVNIFFNEWKNICTWKKMRWRFAQANVKHKILYWFRKSIQIESVKFSQAGSLLNLLSLAIVPVSRGISIFTGKENKQWPFPKIRLEKRRNLSMGWIGSIGWDGDSRRAGEFKFRSCNFIDRLEVGSPTSCFLRVKGRFKRFIQLFSKITDQRGKLHRGSILLYKLNSLYKDN